MGQQSSRQLDEMHSVLQLLVEKLNTFEEKLNTVENTVKERLNSFEEKLNTFEEKLNTFEQKLVAFEQKLLAFEQKLVAFEAKLGDVARRATASENHIGRIAEHAVLKTILLSIEENWTDIKVIGDSPSSRKITISYIQLGSMWSSFEATHRSWLNSEFELPMTLTKFQYLEFNILGHFQATNSQIQDLVSPIETPLTSVLKDDGSTNFQVEIEFIIVDEKVVECLEMKEEEEETVRGLRKKDHAQKQRARHLEAKANAGENIAFRQEGGFARLVSNATGHAHGVILFECTVGDVKFEEDMKGFPNVSDKAVKKLIFKLQQLERQIHLVQTYYGIHDSQLCFRVRCGLALPGRSETLSNIAGYVEMAMKNQHVQALMPLLMMLYRRNNFMIV